MPSIGGKAFVPHRHEQEHSPPLPTLPAPCTVDGLDDPIAEPDDPAVELEAMGEATEVAIVTVVAVIVAVDVAPVVVPFCAMAIALKAS